MANSTSKPKIRTTPPRWMGYREAAVYLGVGERMLRRWVPMGRVPHTKLGQRVMFSEEQLDDFVAANTFIPANV